MNAFVEHYIPAAHEVRPIGPRTLRLASIQCDISDDVQGAVQKWEQMGFVRLGSSDDHASEGVPERSSFSSHAAAIGASLVVSAAWPAPPCAVYLAPTTLRARQLAESAPGYGSWTVEIHRDPPVAASHVGPATYKAARVRLGHTNDLPGLVDEWGKKGFVTLGLSEVAGKNNVMGFSDLLCCTAVDVGAALVVFQITPAKLRAIRRNADGRIDIDAVRADPPANMHSAGYSVTQAVFLAPTSIDARDLAESAAEFGGRDVPIGPDA
jgi:hypothetical protein